jgi:hypothetical protein
MVVNNEGRQIVRITAKSDWPDVETITGVDLCEYDTHVERYIRVLEAEFQRQFDIYNKEYIEDYPDDKEFEPYDVIYSNFFEIAEKIRKIV